MWVAYDCELQKRKGDLTNTLREDFTGTENLIGLFEHTCSDIVVWQRSRWRGGIWCAVFVNVCRHQVVFRRGRGGRLRSVVGRRTFHLPPAFQLTHTLHRPGWGFAGRFVHPGIPGKKSFIIECFNSWQAKPAFFTLRTNLDPTIIIIEPLVGVV